jgi:hypothetical protein
MSLKWLFCVHAWSWPGVRKMRERTCLRLGKDEGSVKRLLLLLALAGCHHDPGKLVAVRAGVQVDALAACNCGRICTAKHHCEIRNYCDGRDNKN